jgi:NDP-sugar pyrophosphorylase family protein
VIVSCAAGQGDLFSETLADLGAEIACAEEPERLGRGGGIKFAARKRQSPGDVFALNGDELVAVDFRALLARHRETGAAATIAVARPASPFGVVELGEDDVITGFKEGGQIPYWVSCGVYVLSEEAVERLPDIGDHETTTFPELVAEGRLRAYRHEGLWLTVNTPKELRRAQEHVEANPEWLGA